MHVYYKFGLFLIFILSVSQNYSKAIPSPNQGNSTDDYDYEDDYYDDDKISTSPPSTTKKPATKFSLSDFFDTALGDSNQSVETVEDLSDRSNETPKCPVDCICRNYNKNVNCSGINLTIIPNDIPATAVSLDLSNNKISEIPMEAFKSYPKLQQLILDGNMITHIDKEVFSSLPSLDSLSLVNNKISEISADTFSDAYELRALNLSNNPLVLPKETSFLHQPALKELILKNTSLTEIYDETFANLSGLNILKLDGNTFNKKINTKAFQPLKELIKLKLPELEEDNIQELCNVLRSIDNISLKRFDISCFQLVSGDTFNQSLITVTDSPFLKPTKQIEPAAKRTTSTPPVNKGGVMTYANITAEKTSDENTGTMNATDQAEIDATTETTEKAAYRVPISQEAINYALISIIIIAIIGLIIGFICRKDYGGIKTKCCRTRKPPPEDQVRPAEEIPLNKIG